MAKITETGWLMCSDVNIYCGIKMKGENYFYANVLKNAEISDAVINSDAGEGLNIQFLAGLIKAFNPKYPSHYKVVIIDNNEKRECFINFDENGEEVK